MTQTRAGGGELRWQQLGILLGGRLVFNTAFRIVYPLLPFLATGLGVDLRTASLLVTVQVAASFLSLPGGLITDRFGERAALLSGLALLTLGTAVCALASGFWLFLLGYGLIGVATALFMPAGHTYASNRSTYSQRGRVLGILELSWAVSALVGVASLARLVEAQKSWGPAFWVLAALSAAMLALTLRLPAEPGRQGGATAGSGEAAQPGSSVGRRLAGMGERGWGSLTAALRQQGVTIALGVVLLQTLAVELVFVVYGAWLERDFRASTEQLGLVFGLLGLFELGGSLGAALLTDRVGKRRAVLAGFGAMGVLVLLLPLSAGRWALFLPLFLVFDLCFEYAIVSFFPLISGLAVRARGTVMALTLTAMGTGRLVGSLAGPQIFEAVGFLGNGLAAGAAALVGVAVGLAFIREGAD